MSQNVLIPNSDTDLLAGLDMDFGGSLDPLGATEIQSTRQPTARTFRREAREQFKRGLKRESLAEILPDKVMQGECVHVISNGTFDYFSFIPLVLGWIGVADSLHGSTWTLSRGNALDLLKYYDEVKIKSITLATGNYFLKRESAVAATIIEGLAARGQRFKAWENHSKIILMSNEATGDYYAIEGSANWTANPRTEQNMIANDRALFEFHRGWLEGMFNEK